ncbi:Kinetochore protein SPC25-like protein [Drosera capensis]
MEKSVWSIMAELRLACDREIETQAERVDAGVKSFRGELVSVKAASQRAAESQVELGKLREKLREAEDELVKAIAVKTRKEAKRMSTYDAITTTTVKVEELKRSVRELEVRKEEYTAIVSQQLDALASSEEKVKQDVIRKDEMEGALGWYNSVLGFQIDGGHGVKFTFANINKECPSEEFSLTIRHANDTCNPHLDDIEDLVRELNRTNGLFRFVRVVREKFLKAAGSGTSPQCTPLLQGSNTISLSTAVSSLTIENRGEADIPPTKSQKNVKVGRPVLAKLPTPSASDLPIRRSSRLKLDHEDAETLALDLSRPPLKRPKI